MIKFFASLFLTAYCHAQGLNMVKYPANHPEADVMICCHGMRGDYHIAENLHLNPVIQDHLIGFNFPDANMIVGRVDPEQTSYGTIRELIPAFQVLKSQVLDANLPKVNLYGFSAGGGAIVNVIALLNRTDYDKELREIGITQEVKERLLEAIQKGTVILECPLKSMEEVGFSDMFNVYARRYKENRLRPIDSLSDLKGLALNILLFFQRPDDIIGNRDDQLYIDRLKEANKLGQTTIVIANEGTHASYHQSLWTAYAELKQKKEKEAQSQD
jgi:hypothetical protein